MDEGVKAQVDEIAELLGMSTAAVFNVFARQFVAHRGFSFEMVAPSQRRASSPRRWSAATNNLPLCNDATRYCSRGTQS